MFLFPLLAFALSLACAALVAADARRRPRPDAIAWAIAFALFATAAGAEVAGTLLGWTPLLARLYYLAGAVLVVGYLGLGQAYLLAGDRIGRFAPGLALLVTAVAATVVLDAPIDARRLPADGWRAIERGPALVALAVSLNVGGTIAVVGGALWSAWRFWRRGVRRHRMLGCLLIAAGTLVVAGGGSLTRLGRTDYLYVAMALGVGLILAGYLEARRRDAPVAAPVFVAPAPEPSPASANRAQTDPGTALIAAWLDRYDAAVLGRLCEEWSASVDPSPTLRRDEARAVWALRLRLPAASRDAFDALPVPVRRQLAELATDVFVDRRGRVAG